MSISYGRMMMRDVHTVFGPGGYSCSCCNPIQNLRSKWGRKRCPSKAKQKGRDVQTRATRRREKHYIERMIREDRY